jgi:hypothetical protein
MIALLLVLILLHQIVATCLARRERKLLLMAALSRTPEEFKALVAAQHRGTMKP